MIFASLFTIATITAGACILSLLLTWGTRRFIGALVKIHKFRKTDRRITTISNVFLRTGSFVIVLVAAVMILKEMNVDPTPIIASAGVAGLAISFGAQTLIKDIFAGLFILMEDQYSEGDRVKLDELFGTVSAVTLRKTILTDEKGATHHIPHGSVKIVSVLNTTD